MVLWICTVLHRKSMKHAIYPVLLAAGFAAGYGVSLMREVGTAEGETRRGSGFAARTVAESRRQEARPAVQAEPGEEQGFEEAVSPEEMAKLATVPAAIVEEVRDENGLTVDEVHEKFRHEHPDEYAEVMKAKADREAARRNARCRRLDFLGDIDLQYVAEDDREVHSEYVEAMMVREEMREAIKEARARGEEVCPELRKRMQAAAEIVQRKSSAERTALFGAVARSLGVPESKIPEMTSLVAEIISVTDSR